MFPSQLTLSITLWMTITITRPTTTISTESRPTGRDITATETPGRSTGNTARPGRDIRPRWVETTGGEERGKGFIDINIAGSVSRGAPRKELQTALLSRQLCSSLSRERSASRLLSSKYDKSWIYYL